MNIRKFSENDQHTLQEIYIESRRHAFYWMDSSLFALADFDRDTEGELVWVATYTNGPVGFISIWEPNNFIHNLFVRPEVFGQGVGTKLLNVCLKKIGRPATLKCAKPNTKAREFYISRGWRVVSEGEGPDGKYELMCFDDKIQQVNEVRPQKSGRTC